VTGKVLAAVAEEIERCWRDQGYDPEVFADVSAAVLERSDLPARIDEMEALHWVQTADLPRQTGENEYGEPAVTAVRTDRFRLELIFWMNGVARVHQQTAHGAFCVVAGDRLHVIHHFDVAEERPGLLLGNLRPRTLELLERGHVRKVYPGFQSIHSLFFIGHPCVTVSVRAHRDASPYYVYANQHLAYDLGTPRLTVQRRLATLRHYERLRPQGLFERIMAIAGTTDVLDAWLMLATLEPVLPEDPMNAIRRALRERHGEWIDRMLAAKEAEKHQKTVEALLERHENPAHRLLLGLVWSQAAPEDVAVFLRHRFPGRSPSDVAARWVEEMFAWRSLFGMGADPVGEVFERFVRQLREVEGEPRRHGGTERLD
jgi:hypothetical protein